MTELQKRSVFSRIGPGLITACVVVGPGSIVTSSTVGANHGYAMLWVVIVSVVFMQAYMMMGAKLGSVADQSPCDLIRQKVGGWLAATVGISVMIICMAFQAGNNIAVASVFETLVKSGDPNSSQDYSMLVAGLVVAFNAIAIVFLFAFKDLYSWFERLMMAFVGLMLISFVVNLCALGPDPVAMAKGLIPQVAKVDLALLGLIGTTFIAAAAFYQAYLVRQKGWGKDQVKDAIIDARIGSVIMAVITVVLISTAAAGLHQPGQEVQLKDAAAVGEALKPTFGESGKLIFCLGLFCAAYSSFLINAMIGGFMAADGFSLGSKPTDKWPRILTAVNLLMGMFVAIAMTVLRFDSTPAIIVAQVIAVVFSPLIAGVLLWLTSDRSVMNKDANGAVLKIVGTLGLVFLIAAAANTAIFKLPAKIDKYLNPPPDESAE